MKTEQVEKTAQKFISKSPNEDFKELLHISHNLNLSTTDYLENFGHQKKATFKKWNERLTIFLEKLKINENENTD